MVDFSFVLKKFGLSNTIDELVWTLFMCTYYLNSSISMNMGVHTGLVGKVNRALTGWQVELKDFST